MTTKRAKAAATDDELGELFEGIGDSKTVKPAKQKPSASKTKAEPEQDILAELENQLGEQPSRPHTPRLREAALKGASSKRASLDNPPSSTAAAAEQPVEDKSASTTRKSADSASSVHATFTPSATASELQEHEKQGTVEQQTGPGGGWWGGLFATATAAMKQAEAAVKEIQQNEEAKKLVDQVRGNVGALRGLGDEIRHRALPTFTNILHTIAPPISSHERLAIHITHDLVGYPSLDPLVYGVFARVMSQVEGGDLLVIQRGHESSMRSPTSEKGGPATFFSAGSSDAGWRDGPWWRATDSPRDLGTVRGLTEGTKLCRASAEGYAAEYLAQHGGIAAARQRAAEPLSESNPVRSSDLFLAVQAVAAAADTLLFAGSAADERDKQTSTVLSVDEADDMVCFAVYVLDPVHEIQYATLSQHVPAQWLRWMDAPAPLTPASADDDGGNLGGNVPGPDRVPEEIREIVENGGVDPREWVAEWVEEMLALAVGVVAQRYVARRMGVGEGGLGKGKRRTEVVVQEGGDEAARAGLI